MLAAGLLLLSGCAAEIPPAPNPTASSASASPTATPTQTATETSAAPDAQPPAAPQPPAFDAAKFSIDDPSSLWVVSNKLRPLNPISFEPADLATPSGLPNPQGHTLRTPAVEALATMAADAAAAGINLSITSGYRSYNTQVGLYNGYVSRDGSALADTYSARPGHSEHQTGLAVDLTDGGGCTLDTCFAGTAAGQWLAANAPTYGFVLRYPEGKQGITGFMFEPWHFRFVGAELSQHMATTGTSTLEEFFGLPAAPDYAP
nr:M15 family metallopeptidase [Lysinibacter cavernae]